MSKSIGNYTLLSKLGSGSYAQVYKAQHKTGDLYAMKVISREKIGSTKLQENLDSEISIMRDYRHENIVLLYDHFSSPRHIYLVLEYCAGGDLQKYIKKHGRLTENVTRKFLHQLAKGLSFLHSKNIIHRDIKPQNLLLSESSDDAIIKYADFGFAKHLVEASMAQTPCGTPLYMAPEIFEMQEYNVKADLWSLGCVVFEMLVGSPPFKGQNPRELFMNIRSRHIRIPPEVVISAELKQLLLQILELDPRNRIALDSLLTIAERLLPPSDAPPQIPSLSSQDDSSPIASVEAGKPERLLADVQKVSGSPTHSPRTRDPATPEMDQPPSRPSGIAIDLLNNSGGSMRRVRSRDQISGGASYASSSPPSVGLLSTQVPAPISTSPANQRPSSVTSATATMIMALANSSSNASSVGGGGSSPSQGNLIPMHRRTNSGERRASTADSSSPVMKALSIPRDLTDQRYASNSDLPLKKKDYHSGSSQVVSNSRGSTMMFGLAGSSDSNRSGIGVAVSKSQVRPSEGAEDGDDDFVLVEQTPSHPWKAIPTDPSQSASQSALGIAHWYAGSEQQASSNVSGGGGSTGNPQEESMHFQATAKRCSYTVQMVTTIAAVADQLVRDSLHLKPWRRREAVDQETKESTAGAADDDSVGSSSSGDRTNRPRHRSFDIPQPEHLAAPFSLYLHAMTFLRDAIQRTLKFKQMNVSGALASQTDLLLEALSKRFDQILQRAENCKKYLTPDQPLPVPEKLLYDAALRYGQEASVDELLGNFLKASERYQAAKLLIDCVLMTASESSDRKVLQQFIQMFSDQITLCEESKSML